MENKIYAFLGLAARAGRLAAGHEACERIIKKGKACLVITAEDGSQNTVKRFEGICRIKGVNIRRFGLKDYIGRYIGKTPRSVIVITDKEFAGKLLDMIDNAKKEAGGE